MQGILNSFSAIINMFKTMINVIANIFLHLGDLYDMSARATQICLDMINTLPVQIQYFALMSLVVSVLFLILGKMGGKS